VAWSNISWKWGPQNDIFAPVEEGATVFPGSPVGAAYPGAELGEAARGALERDERSLPRTIGCALDLDAGEISFFVDGKGCVAFSGLSRDFAPFFASFTCPTTWVSGSTDSPPLTPDFFLPVDCPRIPKGFLPLCHGCDPNLVFVYELISNL
jgi:hypothetical protein